MSEERTEYKINAHQEFEELWAESDSGSLPGWYEAALVVYKDLARRWFVLGLNTAPHTHHNPPRVYTDSDGISWIGVAEDTEYREGKK